MNSIFLTGNLGRNPELQVTAEGTPVTKFSLAVRNYSPKQPDATQWFNIVCWNKTAEIAEKFLQKGDKVTLSGKMTSRKYTDKDGVNREWWEVVAFEIELPSRGRDRGPEPEEPAVRYGMDAADAALYEAAPST